MKIIKTKAKLMPPRKIISAVTKSHSNSPSPLLPSPLAPSKIVQKKPSRFASALAHEVRNPLSNINLATEMLRPMISNDEKKMYLDMILRAAKRINEVVIDFLAVDKTNTMQSQKHSIPQLLDEVIAMIEDRIRLKKIAINKSYITPDHKIILDRPKMKIALTNIIINAIEAMTPGKGELKLITKSIDDKYIIQIEDNGCGISKENMKKLFKPYFTTKPRGLGVGLATTYNILQSNHVGVNVESKEGVGTRFSLSFKKQDKTDFLVNPAAN